MSCLAPRHALSIRFNGDVVPDCVYTGRHGNLLKNTLPEIFKDPGLIATQQIVEQGSLPSNCIQCVKKEKVNGHSRRKFFEQVLNPIVKEESKNKNDIYFLEFPCRGFLRIRDKPTCPQVSYKCLILYITRHKL